MSSTPLLRAGNHNIYLKSQQQPSMCIKFSRHHPMSSAKGHQRLKSRQIKSNIHIQNYLRTHICVPSYVPGSVSLFRARHHNLYIQNHAAYSHEYKTYISTTYVFFSAPDNIKITKSNTISIFKIAHLTPMCTNSLRIPSYIQNLQYSSTCFLLCSSAPNLHQKDY